MRNQPMQPLIVDRWRTMRFQANTAVCLLVDHAAKTGMGLERLAELDLPIEDRIQLAQLQGNSVGGFCSLPYVPEDTKNLVEGVALNHPEPVDARDAEIVYLRRKVARMEEQIRGASAALRETLAEVGHAE